VNEACSIIRSATDNEEMQLNFGVIANETMGDSVKVTVIATGFTKPVDFRESVIEPKPAAEFFADRTPEPMWAEPALPTPPAVAPAPPVVEAPMPMAAAPVFEEELDVPAYLRQGKLLN
jgi:cell division protein FtsZ